MPVLIPCLYQLYEFRSVIQASPVRDLSSVEISFLAIQIMSVNRRAKRLSTKNPILRGSSQETAMVNRVTPLIHQAQELDFGTTLKRTQLQIPKNEE